MIEPPPQNVQPEVDSDDSDWDDDDDFASRKINIRIKPIAQVTPSKISASVDELRATVGSWKSLANLNLKKPNSRRHHQSTLQLNQIDALNIDDNLNHRNEVVQNGSNNPIEQLLPVAFAIQECLNVRIKMGSNGCGVTNLIGHLKMAVPRKIVKMSPLELENNLDITVSSALPWNTIETNELFVQVIADENVFASEGYVKKLSIDMNAIRDYAKQQNQKHSQKGYFLMPEILKYTIRSQTQSDSLATSGSYGPQVSPLQAMAHWLCDLNVTKVRVDFELLENFVAQIGVQAEDVQQLKVSLIVNGGVISYQSKPEATWNALDSKLVWTFKDLATLIQQSTLNGLTSCLAKFNLGDGPSTPSDVGIQFSIAAKTLSGSQLTLDSKKHYLMAKRKYEVKTGIFKCEPFCF